MPPNELPQYLSLDDHPVVPSPGLPREFTSPIWDVAIIFPVAPGGFLNESQLEILHKLEVGRLQTKLFYSAQRDLVYCKVKASFEVLQEHAQQSRYQLPLDSGRMARLIRDHGLTYSKSKRFADDKAMCKHLYAAYTADERFQVLYKHYDDSEGDYDQTMFRQVDRLRLIESLFLAPNISFDIAQAIHDGDIVDAFPLHNTKTIKLLQKEWVTWSPWKTRPPDEVRHYFGEQVALYFEWLGFYLRALVVPAALGILTFILWLTDSTDSDLYERGVPLVATLVSLWSSVFLSLWKQRNAHLRSEWGMMDFIRCQRPRPQFSGDIRPSPINGLPEIHFPMRRRFVRCALSHSVVISFVCMVVAALFGIFFLRHLLSQPDKLGENASALTAVMVSLEIVIMNKVYTWIAVKLNDWENHRTFTQWEDALIWKTFLFHFGNTYSSLFYIAFFKASVEGCRCSDGSMGPDGDCMQELFLQIASNIIIDLVSGNFWEVVLPKILSSFYKRRSRGRSGHSLSQPEKENTQNIFDTIEDYNEMIIQFGYVTLFTVAFPIAPVLALLNNYFEIRVDAHKLCRDCRRPWPRGTAGIGAWEQILYLMSHVAIATNLALVVWTSTTMQKSSTYEKLVVFLIAENILLLIKYAIEKFMREVPKAVRDRADRQRYLVETFLQEHPGRPAGQYLSYQPPMASKSINASMEVDPSPIRSPQLTRLFGRFQPTIQDHDSSGNEEGP